MSTYPTTLERAFTLARSGQYAGVAEIRSQLKVEGYQLSQLEGPSLQRQLRELCVAAKPPAGAEVVALDGDDPSSATVRGRS